MLKWLQTILCIHPCLHLVIQRKSCIFQRIINCQSIQALLGIRSGPNAGFCLIAVNPEDVAVIGVNVDAIVHRVVFCVYQFHCMSPDKKPHLRTVGCCEEEAELYSPFNHIEYEKTLQQARQKFGVYEQEYGDIKYWNDPDYLFDWTEGVFM